MEPLKLLIDHTARGKPLEEIDYEGCIYYAIGELAYPRDTPTIMKSKRKEYNYTMEELMFYWERQDVPIGSYVKEAAGKKVGIVTRVDVNPVLNCLRGDPKFFPEDNGELPPCGPPVNVRLLRPAKPEPENRLFEHITFVDSIKTIPVEVRALDENLTVDRIEQMRRKRQLQQKKNIVSTDDIPAPVVVGSASSKFLCLPEERVWKTRNSILNGPKTKDFITLIKAYDNLKHKQGRDKNSTTATVTKQPAAMKSYSRYEQEEFQTGDEPFDTQSTFIGANLRNLENTLFGHKITETKEAPKKEVKKSLNPIIIVPPFNLNDMLNIYTAKILLEEGRYVHPSDDTPHSKPEKTLYMFRVGPDKKRYPVKLVANPEEMAKEDWERVIAIFVTGYLWQLKGWIMDAQPVQIFAKYPAFHLYYNDQSMIKNVEKWNVQKVGVDKRLTHLNMASIPKIWAAIEKHAAVKSPDLAKRIGIFPPAPK